MAVNAVSTGDLDGLFKQVYADKLGKLIPDNTILVKKIKFEQRKRIGANYNYPVVLKQENGITQAMVTKYQQGQKMLKKA